MKRVLLATTALAMFATPAAAQLTTGETAGTEDVIVVTAQKREQDIRDVPLAITAFDQAGQDRLGIQQFDDLADFVPGLEVQEQSANNPGFVIRGITSDSGDSTIEPRVAIFQDGVPISRSRGSFVELIDSQVEVVRGPQPTLFGRSALIGALNVTSVRPQLGERGGNIRVGFGDYGYFITDGALNFDVTENSAIRLAGRYKKRDGYITNVIGEDLNGFDTTALRGSFRWQPMDTVDVNLIANYQKDDNPGTSFKSGTFLPVDADGNVGVIDPSEAAALSSFGGLEGGRALGLERDLYSFTGLVDWEINDTFTMSSVTSYREFDSSEVFDPDGFDLPLFAFAENAESEQIFQEFRLGFETTNGITGFVGASYFDEEGSQNVPLYYDERVAQALLGGFLFSAPPGTAQVPPSLDLLPPVVVSATGPVLTDPMNPASVIPLGIFAEQFTNFGETTSYDLFADATWAVTNRLELTAGVRYTYDDKTSGYSAGLIGGTAVPFTPPTPTPTQPGQLSNLTGAGIFVGAQVFNNNQPVFASDEFDGFTYRAAAKFDITDDVSVFANYGHGRRPEVFAYQSSPADFGLSEDNFAGIDAEETDAFEVGFRGEFFDGTLNTDLVGYYYEYTNFQTTIRNEAGGLEAVNAGNASGPGFEASVVWTTADYATFFATYAFNGVEFDGTDDEGNRQLRAGNQFRLSPEYTTTIGAEFTMNCGCGPISLIPVYVFKSETFFDDDNDLTDNVQDEVENGYHLLDLRLRWQPDMIEGGAVELFVENVTDERYLLDAGNTGDAFGIPTFIAAPPRTMGVVFSKEFGPK